MCGPFGVPAPAGHYFCSLNTLIVPLGGTPCQAFCGTNFHPVDFCTTRWYYLRKFTHGMIIGGMKVVNSHLKVLVAQKELREKRKLGIRVITAESGASRSAVQRLLNNSIKLVPLDDLGRLCVWLPCEVGELLRLEEEYQEGEEVIA